MQSVLESLPRDSRVAVLRLRSLGDCVLTTPAVELLKRCRPDLRVAIVVEDRFRDIFAGNPDIEEILTPEAAAVRGFRPRVCLNLHGGTRSAWLTASSGASWRAGFAHFRHGFVYNIRIPRAQEILGVERKVHTAEHLACAAFYLGAPLGEIPRAKLAAAARGQATGDRAAGGCGQATGGRADGPGMAAVHPFGAAEEKCWGADGFLAVAEYLRGTGVEPVFIGAAGDDLAPFRAYRCLAGAPLSDIKELLSGSSLFVGNDSGPAHMAAAFGIPVVVIFGPSDPAIWGPWRTAAEVVQSPEGIRSVTADRVIGALARLRVAA